MNYLNMVRKVAPSAKAGSNQEWLMAWRAVARLTDGITKDDPRFAPMKAVLDQCEAAFSAGDWAEFQQAAIQLRVLEEGKLV